MKILGQTPTEIISAVECSVQRVCEVLLNGGIHRDPFGYFTILNAEIGAPVLITKIGRVPNEKLEKCRLYSLEKAVRLSVGMESQRHESSWESRNPDEEKWGGAISVTGGMIFSFSGLPELADEAAMLDVALCLHYFNFHVKARRIATRSGNHHHFILHP